VGSKVENIIDDRGSDLSDHDASPKSPYHQENFKSVNHLPLNSELRASLALTNQKNG
jgi:hypothetical protein